MAGLVSATFSFPLTSSQTDSKGLFLRIPNFAGPGQASRAGGVEVARHRVPKLLSKGRSRISVACCHRDLFVSSRSLYTRNQSFIHGMKGFVNYKMCIEIYHRAADCRINLYPCPSCL